MEEKRAKNQTQLGPTFLFILLNPLSGPQFNCFFSGLPVIMMLDRKLFCSSCRNCCEILWFMYSSCVLSWYTLSKNLIFVFCGAQLGLEMCDTQKVSLANPVFKIFGWMLKNKNTSANCTLYTLLCKMYTVHKELVFWQNSA